MRQKLKFPFDQSKIRSSREELQKAISILNVALAADAVLAPTEVPLPSPQKPTHRPQQPALDEVDDVSSVGQKFQAQRLLQGPSDKPEMLQDILRHQRAESGETAPDSVRRVGRVETLDTNADEHLMPLPSDNTHSSSNRPSTDSSIRSQRSRSSVTSVGSTIPTTRVPASPTSQPVQEDYFQNFHFPRITPTLTDPDGSDIGDNDGRIEIDLEDRDEIAERLRHHPAFQRLEPKFAIEAEHRKGPRADLDEWLSCGIWWLLKSRKIMDVLRTDQPNPSARRTGWPIKVSQEQAAVDLLKACFIVNSIVFSAENIGQAVKNSTWKSAKDLITAVHEEISVYDTIDMLNDSSRDLEKLHLSFNEKIHQPVESPKQLPAALDSFLPSRRWLTIHTDHAGEVREKVLYRTFVNAQIGEETVRRKSPSAPYLLVLWSQHGRSEVLVSLANQLGTVNLSCTLTDQDLRRHEEHTRSSLEFELNFPSQDTIVQFLCQSELNEFLDHPKNFFRATSEREARPEEFLVFREGLHSFNRRTNNPGPRASISGGTVTQAHSSCEVSLYELVPSECWKTQRRLVITSALDATRPWCSSYWIPISKVRVTGEGRDVELHWSDCNQLERKNNGYHGYDISLVYNPDSPNVNVNLQFQDIEAASEFKAAILRPWAVPFETDSFKCKASVGTAGGADDSPTSAPVGQELTIWQVMDADAAMRQAYLSIVYIERNNQTGFVSNVYFVHRDVDFAVEQLGKNSVSFEGLRIPHPISNIVRLKYTPKVEGVCENVEWGFANADFHFEDDEGITRFMGSLIGWDLVFCCRISSMQMGAAMAPGSWRQRDVIITVWGANAGAGVNRGLRLTARWMGEVQTNKDYRWTAAVISSAANCTIGSGASKVMLKDVDLTRGVQLDIKTLAAVDLRGRSENQHKKNLVLIMPDAIAAHQLHNVAAKALNPSWVQNESSKIYRPVSLMTETSSSKSLNDASRFLG